MINGLSDMHSLRIQRMRLTAIAIISVLMAALLFFTSYRSAFEADQACHFEKASAYEDNAEFGCDHDLETKQWLLFQRGQANYPAKVIKRFRY